MPTSTKLSDLSAAGALDGSELLYLLQAAVDKKIQVDSLRTRLMKGVPAQCRLSLVSTNLVLAPFNGNKITIDGSAYDIPDAGVSLSPSGLVANANYYIYAKLSAPDTIALEASTTVYAAEAATGLKIKTGDATRSLVGFARTTAGVAWVDTVANRYVRSWYNSPRLNMLTAPGAALTTVSGAYSELNSGQRCNFLAWASEVWSFTYSFYAISLLQGELQAVILGLDGVSSGVATTAYAQNASYYSNAAIAHVVSVAEGHHYVTIGGQCSSTGGTTWAGSLVGSN